MAPVRRLLRNSDNIYYGWVIVVGRIISGYTLHGIRYYFGLFFKSLQGEFEFTCADTSSIIRLYF